MRKEEPQAATARKDDDSLWHPPPNHYGKDGPVISRRCACGKLAKLPNQITVTLLTNDTKHVTDKIHCPRCGETKPVILCWGPDLEGGLG